jgi:hypothetical protein
MVGDRDPGVLESRSVWAYVGPVRLYLSCRSCKGHLSIRQIRITVAGNERVGEGTVLVCLRSCTGILFLVAVIRVMGRCRAVESGVPLTEVDERIWVSRGLVSSIEVLSI